jgi:hypothetical protein
VEAIYKSWGPGATPYGFSKPTIPRINVWASYAIDSSIESAVNSDGKLVLSLARDLKGNSLTAGGITTKSPIVGNTLTPDATIIASGILGNYSGIINVIGNGTAVTVTTALAHGLIAGSTVIMSGFVPASLNGTYLIVSVPTTTTFTFTSTSGTQTALGVITPLVSATITTSPQMIVYTSGSGPTAVSKPAWQWARDYGPGTTATSLLPVALQGWATVAPVSTVSMTVDTTTYI